MSSLTREIRTAEYSSTPRTKCPSCPPSPGKSGQVSPPPHPLDQEARISKEIRTAEYFSSLLDQESLMSSLTREIRTGELPSSP
jgi:hypothetical protein